MALATYKDNVFINCPFDNQYKPVLDAVVFAVHDAGFVVAGQDIYSHDNQPEQAIGLIGNWLRTESKRVGIPGQAAMCARYQHFQDDLPELCAQLRIQVKELTFVDYFRVVVRWLKKESSR